MPNRPGVLLAHRSACASLAALVLLCLAWELSLAPLRPGGSWLVLKALPLAAPLPGVLQGRIYTCRWAILLILAYLGEGLVRAFSDRGPASTLALLEVALALAFFVSAICYIRARTAESRLTAGRSTGSA
jgi:uncharacterized membrane protein